MSDISYDINTNNNKINKDKNKNKENNNNKNHEYSSDENLNININLNSDNENKNENYNNKNNRNKENKENKNEFNFLKEKYKRLKEENKKEKEISLHWKNSYYNLLKNSLMYDESIKSLIEENRIHQEYIINLEKKNNKVLISCTESLNNFHEILNNKLNLAFFKEINNDSEFNNNNNVNNYSEISNNNTYKILAQNFNEIIQDYKKQLNIFFDEKENLFRNLSLTRHQNLQMTLKLEEMQNRIYYIEKLNADDKYFRI